MGAGRIRLTRRKSTNISYRMHTGVKLYLNYFLLHLPPLNLNTGTMEKEPKSQMSIALTYGSILGFAAILVSLIFYFLDMQFSSAAQWLTYGLMVLFISLGILNYRDKQLNGFISYGKALGTGTLISLIGGAVFAVYFFVFISYIDTDYFAKMSDYSEQISIEKGYSEEQIQQSAKVQAFVQTPGWMAALSLLGYVLTGFFFSLIIGLFLKKKDESFEGNFRG
jgi:hypothetical protein